MGNLSKSQALLHTVFSSKLLKKNLPKPFYLKRIIVGIGLCIGGDTGSAQITGWDFDKPDSLPSVIISNVSVSELFQGNNNGVTSLITNSSSSSGYAGFSGKYNAGAAAITGAFDKSISTFFEFTLTPSTGYSISITSISFGSRSTGTGPQAYSIRTSIDSYNSDLISGIFQADSKWYLYKHSGLFANAGNAITFRIYGFNGTGSAGKGVANWRIDDLLLGVTLNASETYFQSQQNGDWSAPSTWQSSPDNISWYPATKTPTKDAETILIKAGHTVKVTTPVSFDQTTIAGILELQNGGVLNINDGAGDDLLISSGGILKILTAANCSTSVIQSPDANINISKGGKITIGNGISSMGKGYEAFATSQVNIWNDGSVFEFNDMNVFVIANLIYFPNASETEIPIFRISKVNGSIPAGKDNNFLLNGLLELNTDVTFTGAGGKTFRNGIRGIATITQLNAGKIYITAPGALLEGTPLRMNLAQSIDLAPATFIPSDAHVIVSGANLNNNISGNVLEINGILDVTTNGIGNANGKIILNGTFKTANPGGFSGSGSSIVSGNVVLNQNCTIELYANGNQSLNARTDFKNITFSGSGVKKPTGPFSPNGTIIIKEDAIFDCSGNLIGDDNTNLTMTDNSRLIVNSVNTNPKMNGLYNLTGGVVQFNSSQTTPQTIRNQTYQNIEITGTNVNNSDGNITLRNGGTFTVKNGGTFTINDNTIAGPSGIQTVLVESGGTFKTGNNKGFHGFAFTSAPKFNSSINADIENIILQPNSTVEYSRASPPLSSGEQPITNANNLFYQNLVLSGTGNKIAPSDNLIIQGNFSKTGSAAFVHNNGTVIFNGSDEQTYACSSPQMIFNVLKNQNTQGFNVNDSLAVYKELSLGNNSKITLNADITLLSSKNQTASISPLPASTTINYGQGCFIPERFINTNTNGGHGKSWQLVSIPAFGETIFNTWQEKGNNKITGYGTWITDPAGTGKGFDAVSLSPSMKYFDAESYQWVGVAGTNITLENEKGYMIFVRGDRNSNAIISPATPTVLRTRGKLYSPQNLPPISKVPADKFQCVGNPYASAIDFSKINRSPEIENSFRVWDPEYYGVFGFGGYQTISAAIGYRAVPGGSSIYNTTSDYRNIQSGQAFFVHNFTRTEGSISFSEDCKVPDGHRLVNRMASTDITPRKILTTKLILQNTVVDGNAVAFDNKFSNNIDNDDALKINNSNENFGIKRNGQILTIEAREELKAADTIFYNLENLSKQSYRLLFIPEKMQDGLEAFLIDQYLKTESVIDLKDTSSIDFSVTSDASSTMSNRFLLVFRPVIDPVEISLSASQKHAHVLLEWNAKNEKDIKEYHVEHSTNGANFTLLEIIPVHDNSTGSYNLLHKQAVKGTNYYRIRIDKSNGKNEYSGTVNLLIAQLAGEIKVYPNPIHGENVNLLFLNQPDGIYQLRLLNSSGQVMISKEMNFSGGNDLQTFPLKRNMAHGVYYIEIKKPTGEKQRLKVIY